ncbi:MAG: type II toxin-antitoxin system VapC family toxin [Acidimicrobiales bacterium]
MTAPGERFGQEVALADTSLFIAIEQDRPLSSQPPDRVAVSVITVGELRLGVLAAQDGPTRARRLETLSAAALLDPLPVDEEVAHAWAALRLALRDAGKKMPINHSWIAATAIANDLAVASQDGDYDDIPGLRVVRV